APGFPYFQEPADFDAANTRWVDALDAYIDGRTEEVVKLAAAGKENTDPALQVELAIMDLTSLLADLRAYKREHDDELWRDGSVDEQLAARIRVARTMQRLDERYTLPTARAEAKKVLDNKFQLALNGTFVETHVEFGDLSREIPSIEGVGQSGITSFQY